MLANFRRLEVIGCGSSGTVYKARDIRRGEKLVALKEVAIKQGSNSKDILKEAEIMK